MEPRLADLVWRGVQAANPWWMTGQVPSERAPLFRRHAFPTIYQAVRRAEPGRGVVVLGPRRVGKSVLVHQVVQQLLQEGVDPEDLCFLALDDVALRGQDLGELLDLVQVRRPLLPGRVRYLMLDEVQHSPTWAGWLKRLADRRDPVVFLATGSSATALRRGGVDAGVGRWREMTLFPWSLREHVHLRGITTWTFTFHEQLAQAGSAASLDVQQDLARNVGPVPPDEGERLEQALVDYLLRGGFPEAALAPDLAEARRRLRQDILDRALGRDVTDVMDVDARSLERMFLRICMNPGGLWNATTVASDLGLSVPTVNKYLGILEQAFLVFRLDNLASPIKGRPKVYLVAPALRQALLNLDEAAVREPQEWGALTENLVAATAMGVRPQATSIGFWRRGDDECDVVILNPPGAGPSEYLEVKRSGSKAVAGIQRAAEAIKQPGTGLVLARDVVIHRLSGASGGLDGIQQYPVASWLYWQRDAAGGTLRVQVS